MARKTARPVRSEPSHTVTVCALSPNQSTEALFKLAKQIRVLANKYDSVVTQYVGSVGGNGTTTPAPVAGDQVSQVTAAAFMFDIRIANGRQEAFESDLKKEDLPARAEALGLAKITTNFRIASHETNAHHLPRDGYRSLAFAPRLLAALKLTHG